MSPLMQIIGVVVLTFWCSRAALWLLRNWRNRSQRTVVAHIASLLFLAVVAGWFERSALAVYPFLPGQLLWLVLDFARQQPKLFKSKSRSRRRSSESAGGDAAGRRIAVLVGAVTAVYVAVGLVTFLTQSISYAEVYLVDPGQNFRKADRSTVSYVLGRPDFTRPGGQAAWTAGGDRGNPEWLYKSPLILVRFDRSTGLMTSLVCQEDPKESCPANLGVQIGDIEDQVYEVLGAPTSEYLLEDGRKVMRYQDVGHDFVLERLRVKSVRVYPDNGDLPTKLVRLLVWMLP